MTHQAVTTKLRPAEPGAVMVAIEINRVACEECDFVILRPIFNVPFDAIAAEYEDFKRCCKYRDQAGLEPELCPAFKSALDKIPAIKIVK